ncbi:NAD-dependent epimerase [Tenacibaculum mesophilum]|uniref:NAD-dependent epimerase n=1 Tax=Tenacibaculum mesophilum TaxID=104268 RepID=A0AAE9MPD1_9FLAO|nr:NAD-dependent epimerase [Tenacibaculum mesophilum]GFD96221.1 NAD-dependent epimerase [Alteromonas sp. KUL154]GFE00126.1 NAD-dependent epimerase [Alteromonas sp. KUL156]KAF9658597.1 NAD-dependent epimerase [Tenacibaculum mesophilum]UTD15160.1 NAD-dependent epimerase [Tenacibaculum mesophilum]BFF36689.1 NAD-dependent epimerase [Tenacibaculum mesophilum]
MKILVTGAAGFIGFHLSQKLLELGHTVVGIDNINDYYDVNLKYARLKELGVERKSAEVYYKEITSSTSEKFKFIRLNLEDKKELFQLFTTESFDVVCNLAAQAGVRYSIENPNAYIQSNIVGFLNILESCRHHEIKHLVYASSSSVYGMNKKVPFSEEDIVDNPVSLYAATKKSNELMAHTYSHLYKIPTTGLRFFTVYGPWGRPDMAPILFADAISNDRPIKVFNNGDMERDFTYIDDIVEGVKRVIEKPVEERDLYKVYNIGNNDSVKLLEFITQIETSIGKEATKEMLPMQMGDVKKTWANVDGLIKDYNYSPNTSLSKGIKEFINWFKVFYIGS